MIRLTEEQRRELDSQEPARALDPETNAEYVLVESEVYDRLKPLFELDPPSREERREQLRRFGQRAGWDDPEMDVYNDLPQAP
jgi:hypothetical protein